MMEEEISRLKLPEPFNFANIALDKHVQEGRGGEVAIYYQDKKLTYKDVQEEANKVGNALGSLGVEIENRITILLPDCPEYIASLFGAMKIGAVPIPLAERATLAECEYFLKDSRSKVLVTTHHFAQQIEGIRHNLKHLKYIITIDEARGSQVSYQSLVREASPEIEPPETLKGDVALMWYTSGTTGVSKGVVHLHQNLPIFYHYYCKPIVGINENDILFALPRLGFAFGTITVMTAFVAGAAVVLMPERTSFENILQTITKYKPTIFIGVPTFLARVAALKDMGHFDISSIRRIVAGSEELPVSVYQEFKERFGMEILMHFCQSEVPDAYIGDIPGMIRAGSVGRLLPGHEVKLLDDEGREVSPGEVGEVWVKSDGMALYYWHKPDKTREAMIGEWYRTGDKLRLDEDGYFWFQSRGDDVIKVSGLKVVPTEVEFTLMQHPAVSEAAVIGAPDETGLTKVKAFVTLNDGYRPSPELIKELQDFVKGKMSPHNYPRWVEFLSELPRTRTEKIQRSKLK